MAEMLKISTSGIASIIDINPDSWICYKKQLGGFETVRPKYLYQALKWHPQYGSLCIVIDGDGLLKDKEINLAGSYFYGTQYHGHPIVGDLIIAAIERDTGRMYAPEGPEVIARYLMDSLPPGMITMIQPRGEKDVQPKQQAV